MVHQKGFDKNAVIFIVKDVEHSGYSRLILQSNQEISIEDIINAVKRERAEDIVVLLKKSSVGEHQCKGRVERAIQRVEGQIVTMKYVLDMGYECKINEHHPLWA